MGREAAQAPATFSLITLTGSDGPMGQTVRRPLERVSSPTRSGLERDSKRARGCRHWQDTDRDRIVERPEPARQEKRSVAGRSATGQPCDRSARKDLRTASLGILILFLFSISYEHGLPRIRPMSSCSYGKEKTLENDDGRASAFGPEAKWPSLHAQQVSHGHQSFLRTDPKAHQRRTVSGSIDRA